MSSCTADPELITELTIVQRYVEDACSSECSTTYPVSRCLWAGSTPYCKELVICESEPFGKVLFMDHEIQSASSDEALYHEHLVHPLMNARRPKRVLVVGGGEGATVREVLKWSCVESVVWVDIDEGAVDLCRRHLGYADDAVYNDARLTTHWMDIWEYFNTDTGAPFDAVILDLPDPDVEALRCGRDIDLYSRAFMHMLKNIMTVDGEIVSHVGPVAPGCRPGLDWVEAASVWGPGHAYHAPIPSFQSEWGFWMSCAPALVMNQWPDTCRVMDDGAQMAAFMWPNYWSGALRP